LIAAEETWPLETHVSPAAIAEPEAQRLDEAATWIETERSSPAKPHVVASSPELESQWHDEAPKASLDAALSAATAQDATEWWASDVDGGTWSAEEIAAWNNSSETWLESPAPNGHR